MPRRGDTRWRLERARLALHKRFVLPFVNIPTSARNAQFGVKVLKNVHTPMRDGVDLVADVYRHAASERLPTVLIRLPYGRSESRYRMPAHGRYWARKGYACVIQDVRGRYASGGQWQPFVHEVEDGYDTIEWIVRQPWSNGRVGMVGESYHGYTAWAAAVSGHPALVCVAPGHTACDVYGVSAYAGGAFCLQTMGAWGARLAGRRDANPYRFDPWHLPLVTSADSTGRAAPHYSEWIGHPRRDAFWDRIDLSRRYADVTVPTLVWGGWYDTALKGTLDDWQGVMQAQREARVEGPADPAAVAAHSDDGADPEVDARPPVWLFVGPTDRDQGSLPRRRIGDVEIGEQHPALVWIERFFEHYLENESNGFERRPRVQLFVMAKNLWRLEHDWPLQRAGELRYYLHSDGDAHGAAGGSLSLEPPLDYEPADAFVYDADKPVQTWLGRDLDGLTQLVADRGTVEERGDVLVYTSAVIADDLDVTGPLMVTLFAASSAADTDFTAALVDVFPDGRTQLVQEGIVRARRRGSGRDDSLLTPAAVYEFAIDLWATSYVFRRDHALRVEVSSSNFDRYDRNPNTGHAFGLDAELDAAEQVIFHSEQYPSHISLRVVPPADDTTITTLAGLV